MIKNIAAIFIILFLFSCSKKRSGDGLSDENFVEMKYDTTAIDSFSNGAISVDVAAQIRRSSVVYQDSILKAKIAADIAKKDLEDKKKGDALEREKLAKEKLEKEKKKDETKPEIPIKKE